ncbi:MAG: hypothetical protein GX336_05755 [Halanaerobiaceae bacterium]|nr:hypothetical protein [Halanaerobiaceae bacterium]
MRVLRKIVFLLLFFVLAFNMISAKPKWQSSQKVDLNLKVKEYVELRLPDFIYMDVKVGEDNSVVVDFFLRTNCYVNLMIESTGFRDENNQDVSILNDYVEYSLDGFFVRKKAAFQYATFRIAPGTKYPGKFRVNWLGASFAEAEWQKVSTGNYQDTITVTVSY